MSNLGVKTKTGVSKHYHTNNFGIVPSLTGSSIKYRFGDKDVCIQLPAKPKKNDSKKHYVLYHVLLIGSKMKEKYHSFLKYTLLN